MILSFLLTILALPRRGDLTQYIREAMARELVTNFAAGRFDAVAKDFNDSLRSALQPDTLAALKQQVQTMAGAFQFIRDVKSSREKDGSNSVELVAQHVDEIQEAKDVVFFVHAI